MASTVIPSLRYRDAPAAIEWLCRAFGFTKNSVYPNPDGTIAHAQLTLGDGMIMLGSVSENEYGVLMRQPTEIGGGNTHGIYLVVSDCDAVYRLAQDAGAEIAMGLEVKDYGGKGFTCRDPEGYLWSVGDYDPWKG
ncbi:MAG: VOC family protein [Acidobacteriota bacterium]|nr:VOC family protein [Acidobacteriota bacterium]